MNRQRRPGPGGAETDPAPEPREALLLDRYRQLLRKAIGRTVPNAAAWDVDDIEQEACTRVLKALRQRQPIQSIDSYVYRIGVTAAIDSLRRVRRRRECGIEEASMVFTAQAGTLTVQTPDTALENAHRLELVQGLIRQLPANRQVAVVLHLQGHGIDEIARELGWTEDKARNLVYRGMNDLKSRAQAHASGVDP